MFLVKTIKDLQSKLQAFQSLGKSVGFVPTMGALHAGHISLVTRAVSENPVVVVSIFVNPTQFNDKKDLEHYPRNLGCRFEITGRNRLSYCFCP